MLAFFCVSITFVTFVRKQPSGQNAGLTALLLCVLATFGCESSVAPEPHAVFPVKGRLFIRNQLVPGACIAFHPVVPDLCGGRCPVAMTTDVGSFDLTTSLPHDGAAVGDYVVTVIWPDYACPVDECEVTDAFKHDRLRGRFADPLTSPLFATVLPGENYINLTTSEFD